MRASTGMRALARRVMLVAGAWAAFGLAVELPDLLPDNFDIRPVFPTDADPLTVFWSVRSEVVIVNADLLCEIVVDGAIVYTGVCRVGEHNAVRIDPLPAGVHTVSVEVDVDGRVGELDEDNNRAALTFPVAPAVAGDLRPGPVRVRPRRPRAGRRVRIGFVLRHRGIGADARLRCRLRVDGRRQVRGPCRPGRRFEAVFTGLRAGVHVAEVVVDDGDAVAEVDESNNLREQRFRVR